MKVSDYIASYLSMQGVTHVYELVGGMITHLLDSVHRAGKIQIISMHHEQGAAFAADAYGRMTGKPGVAFATSGPGATNLLTGIGSCYFDSSPAVFITGQVNRHELKGQRLVRQLGFQETDIVAMAKPITKAAWQVEAPEEIPMLLDRAFRLAMEGRPGPVLIDIPMDVQRAQIEAPTLLTPDPRYPTRVDVQPALDLLRQAERPLILAGGGIRAAGAIGELRQFAAQSGIPVIMSLLGIENMPYYDLLRVGMIGSYGNRWANLALAESDCLLVIGSRLDVRQTGADTVFFKDRRTIIHVDADAGEINNRILDCLPIVSDARAFLQSALASPLDYPDWQEWLAHIEMLRATWPDVMELKDVPGINPNEWMHRLSAGSTAAAAYVVDVGQHQMWAAQSVELEKHQRFLTSGGMGSMGFALPAAISASLVSQQPVVVIAGDGGFQCNIQELQTVRRNNLPLKMVILNNQTHGMVRQFQQSYFDNRYPSTLWGYDAPDFAAVAQAYGIPGATIQQPDEMTAAVEWLWQDPSQPALLQVMIHTFANAYPKIAFGHPISEMEPFVQPIEMEGT